MKTDKIYKLPELPEPENKWRRIPNNYKTIPFGYKVSEEDPDILDPIPSEMALLEEARNHLKKYSYRAVADWLSEASGRYISHMGLKKRLERDRKNRSSVGGYKLLAKRLQKTLEIIRKIEEERPGAFIGYSEADHFPETECPFCSGTGKVRGN